MKFNHRIIIGLALFTGSIALVTGVMHHPLPSTKILNGSIKDSSATVNGENLEKDKPVLDWSEYINKDQISFAYTTPKDGLKGKNLVITMGGMGAKLEWVQKWTEELYSAKLKVFNIGLVIVVKGPKEEYYDSREIAIKEMTKKFVEAYREYGLGGTYLIVHSSGVFPAHQMFDHLWLGGNDPNNKKMKMRKLEVLDPEGITKGKINYIMLDGELGIPNGYTLEEKMVTNLKNLFSFYAVDADTKTPSGMAHEAKKVKERFPRTILYEYQAKGSGCNPGAKWCVHETLITTRPHNPAKYDLEKDYTLFDPTRKVVSFYMDVVRSY